MFTPPKKNTKVIIKKGFTLSEVLITLVIIGVIAAITIPTIIAGSRKSEYSARLKKFYSTLTQAQSRAQASGQGWDIWCEDTNNSYGPTREFALNYLLPYISSTKHGVENSVYTIHMADGTSFYLVKEQCIHFIYDVNSYKKPNVYGRDKYRFTYCPDSIDKSIVQLQPGVLIAYSGTTEKKTRAQAMSACKSSPNTCSTLLMMDGWIYKSDYPHAI